jgi:hypothetical protein
MNEMAAAGTAVDGSGNLWIANQSYPYTGFAPSGTPLGQQLVEFVGIAAPVTTPAVQTLASGSIGARP